MHSKKRWFFILIFLAISGAVWNGRPAQAATNLIPNPSVEQVDPADGSRPAQWQKDTWVSGNATFAYQSSGGHNSSRNLKVTVSNYQSGDAKWYFDPLAITANHKYTYSEWFKSSVYTDLLVRYTDANDTNSYQWLKGFPASSSWKQASASFVTPVGAKQMTVMHIVSGNGWLQTDDFNLGDVTAKPTLTFTAPAANASLRGSVAIQATASDPLGLRGVQFYADDQPIGSEDTTALFEALWDTTTMTNGKHTLKAIATGNSGLTTNKTLSVTVANPAPAGQNIIPNPSVENPSSGSTPQGWKTAKSGTNTPTFSRPSTGAHSGSRSVKVAIASYTSGDAYWSYSPQPVVGGKTYEFSNYYQSDVDTEVYAHFVMQNGSEQWQWIGFAPRSKGWNKFYQQLTIPPDALFAEVYQSLFAKGFLVTDDYKLNEYTPLGFNRGLVSLTFDDALRSIYTNGLPLLQEYQFPSTQYFLSGFTTNPYYMTVDMMRALRDAGHEIGSHTVTHPHLPTLSPTQLQQELTQSKADLTAMLGITPTSFASPYGEYSAETLTAIKQHYASHRSVNAGFNSKDNFDRYDIKVQNIVRTTTPAEVQSWVAKAQADRTWLVLVYHAVDPDDAELWNTPPDDLRAQFDIIQASSIPVVTVDQALSELVPQL